ncbi:DUF3054 domain-containing protein [Micrococcoides hystricis]|uniref:DUF3054 domain-containing protein n=1 Tax=Micrococcoides hystricis TaxID=1572761 RepID=A0ABV6P7C4_9MICC
MANFDEPVEEAASEATEGLVRQSPAWKLMLVIDVVLVLVFAYLGMISHHESADALTYIRIASPFLLAYAGAAIFTGIWRTAHVFWPQGVTLWFITAFGGILLRYLFGDGVALAFQLVAAGTLALFLLGRRMLSNFIVTRPAKRA